MLKSVDFGSGDGPLIGFDIDGAKSSDPNDYCHGVYSLNAKYPHLVDNLFGSVLLPTFEQDFKSLTDDGFSAFFGGEYQNAGDLQRKVRSFADTPVAVFEWCITSGSRVNFPTPACELVGSGAKELPRRGDRLVVDTLHRLAAEGTDTLAVVAQACRYTGIACYASVRMNGDYASDWMGVPFTTTWRMPVG